ncbi:MAG TPA: ABC transporter permease [Candidatus Polarisedimenticolia bacterium]|nr:ABC transporter permease [Candidatus Polarisedimenticolia bacterium]
MSRPRPGGNVAPAALGAVLLLAGLAPLVAPFPPDLQEDVAGARYLPPLARAHALRLAPDRVRIVTGLRQTGSGYTALRAGDVEVGTGENLAAPPAPRFYLLGTDGLGRDLFSRILYGARHSCWVAGLAVGLALLLGAGIGSLAALWGGWRDAALMRGVDVVMAIPRLMLFLLCATLFEPSTLLLVMVLAATGWTEIARLVRGSLLSLRGSDLESAARAAGARPWRTLVRHLLPQIVPLLVVAAVLRFADTVVMESAIALLGLGSPPPVVSLGGIMASGRDALAQAWWIAAAPGLLLAAIVLTLRAAAGSILRAPEPPPLA